jgi:hypothetical protein
MIVGVKYQYEKVKACKISQLCRIPEFDGRVQSTKNNPYQIQITVKQSVFIRA